MNKAFETHQPVKLYVEIGRGRVTVDATATTESTVEVTGEHSDEVVVEQNGDQISVLAPKIRTGFFGGEANLIVTVTVPTNTELYVKTGSADIIATGTWSTTQLKSGSGDVEVESVDAPAVVETGSGDISVGRILEEARIKSGSGDVRVRQAGSSTVVATGSGDVEIVQAAGPTVVKTGSGDLRVATADGDVSMSTGSGDAVIERLNRGKFSLKGASGDVAVGIPSGIPIWTDISSVTGRVRSDLVGAGAPADGQDHIELRAKTVSGDITLKQL
jgi:DUF4097 and DUF4098 domain-containing protein YvlB